MTELDTTQSVDTEAADQKENQSNPQMSTADFLSAGSHSGEANTGTEVERRSRGETTTEDVPLFQPESAQRFRSRWTDIQAAFVDSPREAVENADGLVAETMQQLAQMFADERANLERQWQEGDNISTEDLRQALQRYRSFFDRLLSV